MMLDRERVSAAPNERVSRGTTHMHEPRCAVITGAAPGIGRRTAEVFGEAAYRLALIDLRMPAETLESLRALGVEAFGHAGDITDERTIDEFAKETVGRWGAADVLVNNAGIAFISPAELTSSADYRHVL